MARRRWRSSRCPAACSRVTRIESFQTTDIGPGLARWAAATARAHGRLPGLNGFALFCLEVPVQRSRWLHDFCFARRPRAGLRAALAVLLVAGLSLPGAAPSLAAPAAATPRGPQGCGFNATLVTNSLDNLSPNSLREAIACAADGGTVAIDSIVQNSTVFLLHGFIPISQSITIDGSAAPGFSVDAGQNSRVFVISASGPVTLTALTLQNGKTLETPGGGGAVLAEPNSPLVLIDTSVINSKAPSGDGGGVYASSSLALFSSNILSNTSLDLGGGVMALGNVTAVDSSLQGNKCTQVACQGGGLVAETNLTLTNSLVMSNTSASHGGGAAVVGSMTAIGSTFLGNKCTEASCQGGGLVVYGGLTLDNSFFAGNLSGAYGGGATVGGQAAATGGTFHDNQCTAAACQGGGLAVGGSLALTSTIFARNASIGDGGAVLALGAATVTGSGFHDNDCTGAACLGAGLYAGGPAVVTRSSFQEDRATGWGGALAITGTAQLTLANTTLDNNSAMISGGGLYAGGASQANLYNVTVTNNQAASGGGLFVDAGATAAVSNTILANNTADNCAGPIAGGTHNWSSRAAPAPPPARARASPPATRGWRRWRATRRAPRSATRCWPAARRCTPAAMPSARRRR